MTYEVKRETRAERLPPEWDRLAGDNPYLKRAFLSFVERTEEDYRPLYCMLYDQSDRLDSYFVAHRRRGYNLGMFSPVDLPIPVTLIYLPMCVTRSGVVLGALREELFREIRAIKGFKMVLNLPDGEVDGFAVGLTCPKCILTLRWDSLESYPAGLSNLSLVEGYSAARAAHDGTLLTGVTAQDDSTLVIRLTGPCAYFLDVVCADVLTMPVRQESAEGGWSAGSVLTNGPYTLTSLDGEGALLTRSESYYDGAQVPGELWCSWSGTEGGLEAGEMEKAVEFLGHPHVLTGQVISGQQLGRTLGIPTANLALPQGVICPRFGVYACKAKVQGQWYPAVTNVGCRPTVGGKTVTVEPWLLGFEGDIYGETLCLEFYKFLRPEKKFPSLEALQEEILKNARQTREFFGEK